MDIVTGQHPQALADKIVSVVGDADSNTAYTAIKIAELLLIHRDHSLLEFERTNLVDSD
jgi:hypothetical protein